MSHFDPLASVHAGAKLGKDVTVGPFAVIEEGAEIGDGCVIGPHVLVTRWARLGKEVKLAKGVVVGTDPQDLKFAGEETTAHVGDRTVIREFVTVNRGTTYHMKTVVGADCLLLAYSHIAHDCIIGDHVILDNAVQLAGHVEIGDWVIIGGLSGVQQFVHIGAHAFIGGKCGVRKDVPPFIKAAGEPLVFAGTNNIGLARRGFDKERITAIQQAYRTLYRSGLLFKDAVEKLKSDASTPDVEEIIRFIENRSKHGVIGGQRNRRSFEQNPDEE
ncbi:MAG: acyl-ACP--UDP-N-acetylglucosamine O-acyltransferase [bacterium]